MLNLFYGNIAQCSENAKFLNLIIFESPRCKAKLKILTAPGVELLPVKEKVVGSNPSVSAISRGITLVVYPFWKREVVGSNPTP